MTVAFKLRGVVGLLLGLTLWVQAAAADAVGDLQASIAEVAARVKPSVVRIVAEVGQPAELLDVPIPAPGGPDALSRGSGMIFRATEQHYYILTNAHVVRESPVSTVRIKLIAERETRTGEILGFDLRTDTAVVRMDRLPGENLPLVSFGRATDLTVGSLVLAVGSPFDFEASVTMGIVSSLDRQLDAPPNVRMDQRFRETYRGLIQTDASVNPGNSGGPLVNLRGEVVGTNFAIFAPGLDRGSVGIGFAIPIERSLAVIDDLIERGHAVRGYLGIGIQDVDEAAVRLELPLREFRALLGADAGAYISEVTADSPADRAGLQSGDLIVSVNGQPVGDVGGLQDQISAIKPGNQVRLGLLRASAPLEAEVTLAEMPTAPTTRPEPPAEPPAPAAEANPLGVEIGAITPEAQGALQADGGVLLTAVVPGGAGDRAGLIAGMIVQSGRLVGGEKVEFREPDALTEFLLDAAAEGGPVQLWVVTRAGDGPPRRLSLLVAVPKSAP